MRGYTTIEILITAAIIVLIAGIALAGLKTYKTSSELVGAAEEIISYLEDARAKTLSSQDASQYGVHFEENRIIFFKGTTFVASDSNNVTRVFPASIEISSVSLNGGGSNAIFQRLTGATNNYGAITVRLKNDPLKMRMITIEQSGAAHL